MGTQSTNTGLMRDIQTDVGKLNAQFEDVKKEIESIVTLLTQVDCPSTIANQFVSEVFTPADKELEGQQENIEILRNSIGRMADNIDDRDESILSVIHNNSQ